MRKFPNKSTHVAAVGDDEFLALYNSVNVEKKVDLLLFRCITRRQVIRPALIRPWHIPVMKLKIGIVLGRLNDGVIVGHEINVGDSCLVPEFLCLLHVHRQIEDVRLQNLVRVSYMDADAGCGEPWSFPDDLSHMSIGPGHVIRQHGSPPKVTFRFILFFNHRSVEQQVPYIHAIPQGFVVDCGAVPLRIVCFWRVFCKGFFHLCRSASRHVDKVLWLFGCE